MQFTTSTTMTVADSVLDEIAAYLITTAAEGGINYWAGVLDYKHTPTEDTRVTVVDEADYDDDPEGTPQYVVDVAKMRETMLKLVNGDFGQDGEFSMGYDQSFRTRLLNALREAERGGLTSSTDLRDFDYDASDADDMLQLAAFGKRIYG